MQPAQNMARPLLSWKDMRTVTVLIVAVAVGGALFKYHNAKAPAAEEKKPAAVSAKAQPPPTTPSSTSQHNWPKRAIDRAVEVKRDVAAKHKANEVP